MKRKNIILVMLLAIAGIFAMQGCTKDESPTPVIFKADVPTNPTPAVDVVLPLAGSTYTLKWEGTTGAVDLHFGTTAAAADTVFKVASGKTFNVPNLTGGEYFWYLQTKDANGMVSISPVWNFYINTAPTAPVLTTPAEATVGFSVAGALKWTSSDAEGDDITYDVYLGTTSTPTVVATGLTDPTYSPTMVPSTMYYWKVVATDSHGYTSTSIVQSFTTGLEPIMTFVGAYNVDEPAEAWNYDVTFVKVTSNTIKIGTGTGQYDGWWASWQAVFTLDLTSKTYSMPYTDFGGGYAGVEAGGIDLATGKIQGTYTIWKNGAIIEQGVHTYVKK